jgi:GNAT superfamily N-acetyltransferase
MTRIHIPDVSITLREALAEDAPLMNKLTIDRRFDIVPGHPDYGQQRINWHKANGEGKFLERIRNALEDPDHFFSQVALVGARAVGFTNAYALPDEPFTNWQGLAVERAYEHQGVGRRLETARREWAQSVGRPVRCLVVPTNERSTCFLQDQGFKLVDRLPPTDELPLPFNVMELGLAALMSDAQIHRTESLHSPI